MKDEKGAHLNLLIVSAPFKDDNDERDSFYGAVASHMPLP